MKIREIIGNKMKRKQWVQLGIVASSMVMLTGCYQRYQRQSSPKKRLQRARLQQRNKAKNR